jgi:hypothetical protein
MSKMAERYATSQHIEDLREQLELAATRMHIMAKAYRDQHPASDRNDLFLSWAQRRSKQRRGYDGKIDLTAQPSEIEILLARIRDAGSRAASL